MLLLVYDISKDALFVEVLTLYTFKWAVMMYYENIMYNK